MEDLEHPDITYIRETGENPHEIKREAVYHCEICDEPIYGGDRYYDIFGKNVCENCIDNQKMTA